ncbi:hypothetical protein K432DRAFT_461104 [Lepidopterella palustris CBS 459.81]|uniref:Uncharacterized protein n=1 Tax=Lepidopterella palustris CBS 459.81 TaxID=1314670 RepID=A0A8E2JC96_9PEZI|nr:hypothetical protein K432DRAFT_461104 [Lepidopterella palustris CBS 459.81]
MPCQRTTRPTGDPDTRVTVGFSRPAVLETPTERLRGRSRFAMYLPPSNFPHACQTEAFPSWKNLGPHLTGPERPWNRSPRLRSSDFRLTRWTSDKGLVKGLVIGFQPMGGDEDLEFEKIRQKMENYIPGKPEPWEGWFKTKLEVCEYYIVKNWAPLPMPKKKARKVFPVTPHPRRVAIRVVKDVKEAVQTKSMTVDVCQPTPNYSEFEAANPFADPFADFNSVTAFGKQEMFKPECPPPYPKIKVKKANTVSSMESLHAYMVWDAKSKRRANVPSSCAPHDFGSPLPKMASAFSSWGSNGNGENIKSPASVAGSENDTATPPGSTAAEQALRRGSGIQDLAELRKRYTRFSQIGRDEQAVLAQRPPRSPLARPKVNFERREVVRIAHPTDNATSPPPYTIFGSPAFLDSENASVTEFNEQGESWQNECAAWTGICVVEHDEPAIDTDSYLDLGVAWTEGARIAERQRHGFGSRFALHVRVMPARSKQFIVGCLRALFKTVFRRCVGTRK